MKRRYKYRIYPNKYQQAKLAQLFGCCRVVWNDSLAYCNDLYKQSKKKPSNAELQKVFITQAKKTIERAWLTEVSAIPLQQSLNDLNKAYQNFFSSLTSKRKGIKVKSPKFKKRKSKQTARFTRGGFKISQDKVYLAKIGKLKVIWSRKLPCEPSSLTVIKDSANRYFLSIIVETFAGYLPKTNNSIGIDLGINTFATLSNGEKILAPKPLKKNLKKLAKFQGKFARTEKGSNRREKARLRVAKLHAKIKDVRTDFLHKLSTKLVKQYDKIVLEDLNVSGMVRNRKLSKAISDLGWREFRTLTENKCEKYGREFRVISRWEPTSQRCSVCGFKGGKKELNVREWTCLNCGSVHELDVNAAINILNGSNQLETIETRLITKVEEIVETENPVQLNLFNEVADGQSETQQKRTRSRRNSTRKKVVDSNDVSTRSESFKQLSLFE